MTSSKRKKDISQIIDEIRDELKILEEMTNNDKLSDKTLKVIENVLWYHKVYLLEDLKEKY